ncbi:MAG: hypothetical protein ACKVH8_17685 [Pirellulales bacterium]|jgi:hypothetical protein
MNKIVLSVVVFIYMNLLPYLCRLPKGIEWAKQYLPDEGHLFPGLIFFHCFYSIPAVLLVVSIFTSKKYMIPFLSTFLTLTIVTVYFNHSYDLASDAQAAIGLIVFPIVAAFFGFIAFGLGHAIQYVIIKKTNNELD